MKRRILFSAFALLFCGATASAQTSQAVYQADPGAIGEVAQVCNQEIGCGCETPCDCEMGCDTEPSCGVGGCNSCGVESCGGCDMGCDMGCDAGCEAGCSSGCGGGLFECNLGDPFTLFGESCGYAAGGWVQMGYHDKAIPLFNSRPDEYQLHQAWFWAEKAMDTSCGFDLGSPD